MNPNNLADLLFNPNDSALLYNTSAEEGIFPNVSNDKKIEVPSYVPEFHYDDTTPLVYSWLPIVKGYLDDDYNNLHNFSHINVSDISDRSDRPDQEDQEQIDEKAESEDKVEDVVVQKVEATVEYELENSCNAMDMNFGCREEISVVSCDLSFNGKIDKLKEIFVDGVVDEEKKLESPAVENEENDEVEEEENAELSEEERIRNESFEMLKKEDSTLMIMINEKSPDVLVTKDSSDSEVEKESPEREVEEESEYEPIMEESTEKPKFHPTLRDEKLLKKLKSANSSSILPPPSKTHCTFSLTEMLSSYKENLDKNMNCLETGSLFTSTCSIKESENLDWPSVTLINTLDIMYNRNQHTEAIEDERMKFCEKFIGTETSSSYNFKISQHSAKKKREIIKQVLKEIHNC
jgi:hypothetical protein